MSTLLARLALLSLLPVATAQERGLETVRLVPQPSSVLPLNGSFELPPETVIYYAHERLAAHARVLSEELHWLTGMQLETDLADGQKARKRPNILMVDGTQPDADVSNRALEQYALNITPTCIMVQASTLAATSRATATLLQCLETTDAGASFPCGIIQDAPAASYRAVSIDVARSPHSIDVLRGVVRLARLYKIRFVQLHLTDDQHFTYPFAPVTDNLKNNAVFDRKELAALVAYADARGVTLIPEIDLPGHSSRLIQSGYLDGAENHADVASEKHWPKLRALLDDVIDFFPSSPYFHIGGDESGAGSSLVPFLERVNKHLRKRGKRLIVWEGFHGAPTEQLPPTGDDRILVASWESSYNAPWDLLENGYELINASWRPLYVVGGDSRIHPGSTAGRSWTPKELGEWHKNRFMHWEPGRAVFEDRGPDDDNRDDGIWDVRKPDWSARVLGGQMSVWEQRESSLLRDLRHRLPVVADRLWSKHDAPTPNLAERCAAVDERIWGLVQPIAAEIGPRVPGPLNHIAHHYSGASLDVTLRNRTRLDGEIRWATKKLGGDWNWIDFGNPDAPAIQSHQPKIVGSGALRAALFGKDGKQIGAETWHRFVNWPMRVDVTDYRIGRRVPKVGTGIAGGRTPDFDTFGEDRILARYQLPMLRGPLDHAAVKGQRFEATVVAPESGDLEIGMKTQSGHATLWLDKNRDGTFDASERIIPETPDTEKPLRATVTLEAGAEYALRVDHVSALPRPVVIVTLDKPGAQRPREITQFLKTRFLKNRALKNRALNTR